MNATIGARVTIEVGHLIGTWEFVELHGWGSDGKSSRLVRIGKSGKPISRYINMSASELQKIGVILPAMKAPKMPTTMSDLVHMSDAWTAKREAQVKRGMEMLAGIPAGQPVLSVRDRKRREKAFNLIATA